MDGGMVVGSGDDGDVGVWARKGVMWNKARIKYKTIRNKNKQWMD